jgi:predicted signal transduction protein with EAL and GGDEF domain
MCYNLDRSLILLSVIIAVAASGVGLWLAFHLRQNSRRALINRLIAAFIMALASMLLGMGAATFTHLDTARWSQHAGTFYLGLRRHACYFGDHAGGFDGGSQLRTSRLADNLHQLNCQLEHQVHFDALTGLANRTQIDTCLLACLRHSKLHQQHFALVFIDLDRFKVVNDTWGHHIGDQLLIASTQRIFTCLDDSMTLARLGAMSLSCWFQTATSRISPPC